MEKQEELTVYNAKTDLELMEALHESKHNPKLCAVAFKKFSDEKYVFDTLEQVKFEACLCVKSMPHIDSIKVGLKILEESNYDHRVEKALKKNASRMIENEKTFQ